MSRARHRESTLKAHHSAGTAALNLVDAEYERPAKRGGWGWFHLSGATVVVPGGWVDDKGRTVHRRGLKHRSPKATRLVPVAPQLAELLDRHIELFPPIGGRLFVTRRGPGGRYVPSLGKPLRSTAYTKVWRAARDRALTSAQAESPLARRPYDLRHAAVSTWLNAGVPATQVAAWAGHSVQVLLRIYAKCIDGQDEAARRRIEGALASQSETEPAPPVNESDDQADEDRPVIVRRADDAPRACGPVSQLTVRYRHAPWSGALARGYFRARRPVGLIAGSSGTACAGHAGVPAWRPAKPGVVPRVRPQTGFPGRPPAP